MLLAAILVASCGRDFVQDSLLEEQAASVQCRISVELSDALASQIESGVDVFASCCADGLERIIPDAGEWEARHREAGLHRWYSLTMETASPTKALEEVKSIDGVLYAARQPRLKLEAIPFNDPFSVYQWALFNNGNVPKLNEPLFREGADINVVPVWEKYTAGSPDVIVAVLDAGIYYHPDLVDVIIPAGENGSRNFVDHYSDSPYLIRPSSHATCVASIIGSVNNNGKWLCGVAGGNDGKGGVRLLDCQIIADNEDDPESSYSTNDIMAAMVWAADHGAVICNNSWGFDFENEEDVPLETPQDIAAAVDYFTRYAGFDAQGKQVGPMAGGLVVMAAGNEDCAVAQPAMYENLIAVGAVGPCGERAAYSNYGDWVDISAPGGNYEGYLESLQEDSQLAMIAAPGMDSESLYLYEGTSMSCPFVSGVAALMVSYFGGEGFTVETLKEMLLRGANYSFESCQDKPVGPLVDALGAFNASCAAPAAPRNFSVSSRGNRLLLSWEVTGNGGVATYACRAQVSTDASFSSPTEALFVTSDRSVGDMVSFEMASLEYDTHYYVRIFGEGVDKTRTASSPVLEIRTNKDMLPEAVKDIENIIIDGEGECVQLDLNGYFSDPDGEELEFSVAPQSSKALSATIQDDILSLTSCGYGQVEMVVSAMDYAPHSVSQKFQVLVRDSQKRLFDLFPVPVDDVLNIRPGSVEAVSFRLRISSVGGSVIFDDELSGSAFEPAQVSMMLCGPGVYNIDISSSLGDYSKAVVKR